MEFWESKHNHDRPLIKYNIATHSKRLAMSQKVGIIRELIEGKVESAYDLLNAGVVEGRVEVAAERREVLLH